MGENCGLLIRQRFWRREINRSEKPCWSQRYARLASAAELREIACRRTQNPNTTQLARRMSRVHVIRTGTADAWCRIYRSPARRPEAFGLQTRSHSSHSQAGLCTLDSPPGHLRV